MIWTHYCLIKQIDLLLFNQTWRVVDLSIISKPVKYKLVFRRKYNTNGSIQSFKVELVAKALTQKE